MTRADPFAAGAGPLQAPIRALAWAACLGAFACGAAASEPLPAPAILQELRGFREYGSVLYIAAHPDDENTQLITYLARWNPYFRQSAISKQNRQPSGVQFVCFLG